jgi:hypothetical protein
MWCLMQASTDLHDTGACSSTPPYYSERRPSYPPRSVEGLASPHQSSEYRATITWLSNGFLASVSSLFGGSPSRTRNASTTLSGLATLLSSPIRTGDFTPAKKRSLEAMNDQKSVSHQGQSQPPNGKEKSEKVLWEAALLDAQKVRRYLLF